MLFIIVLFFMENILIELLFINFVLRCLFVIEVCVEGFLELGMFLNLVVVV